MVYHYNLRQVRRVREQRLSDSFVRHLNRACPGGLHEHSQAGGGGIERGQRAEGVAKIESSECLRVEEGWHAIVYRFLMVDVGGWRFACAWLKFRRRRRSGESRPTRWSWRLRAA